MLLAFVQFSLAGGMIGLGAHGITHTTSHFQAFVSGVMLFGGIALTFMSLEPW